MHECQAFCRAVSDYVDGAVDTECRASIDGHLRRCRRCRILCDTLRRTIELYRTAPCACVPPEVEARLAAALERRIGGS